MIEPPVLDVIFLIVAVVATAGLPYAIGGSIQSDKLQKIRLEENAVRIVTILVVAIYDGMIILPLIRIDTNYDVVITAAIAGSWSLGSWMMFSKGTERGADLFRFDLNSMSEQLAQAISYLKDTTNTIQTDHDNNSKSIQSSMTIFAEKMQIDQKINDYARDSAKQEIEEHIPKLYRYCDETLDMCRTDNDNLAGRIVDEIKVLLKEKEDDDSEDTSNHTEPHKDNSTTTTDVVKTNPEQNGMSSLSSSHPTDIQKSQKILSMISTNLSEYKPKLHKLCIVLYNLLQSRQISDKSYRPNLSQISRLSGVNKADAKSRLQNLANLGLITMNKGESKIEFDLSPRLDRLFNPVLENQREGGMESFYLIQQAKKHYLDCENYFEALKQDISIEQPDCIAIPILDNEGFDILNATAIEIESPQEIRSHQEQVKSNMTKNLQWFSKIEIWCYADTQTKIQDMLDALDIEQDQKHKITIMPVHKRGSLA